MIQLINVRNPLQPSVDRETTELVHVPARSLDQYLPATNALTVSLNGKVVAPSLLSLTTPRDGDCIVIVPTLAGGGVLRTLAMIAVVGASIAATALTAGALAGPSGAWATASMTALLAGMAGGAVSIAGNLLISAFLNNPSKKSNTPSYAFDGPHSLAQSGTVIPKGYGDFDWGGNIIASFVDVEGNDQYINALVCYGYGPARKIRNVQINGKPIEEYGNVQYYTRLGSNDQTPIPNFNRVVNGYPQNTRLLAGVPVIVPGTGTLTQILQVDVMFPSGVWVLTNNNNLIPATITYLVEYSANGSGLNFAGSTTAGSTHLVSGGTYLGGTYMGGGIAPGTVITGPGIPIGTTMVSLLPGVQAPPYGGIVLSAAAITTGSGTFAAAGIQAWQPVVQPSVTSDVVTYAFDGQPNPYPTWCAVATDMPPHSGVVYATSSGSHYPGEPYSITETVEMDYPDGTASTYGKVCTAEWQLTQPFLNQVVVSRWTAGDISMTGCSQSPMYQRTSIYGLAPGKYDVRITKYGSARWGDAGNIVPGDNWSPQIGQDMWVHSVNEIALLDLAYPNMILIGVRALATGQLSGSSLNITAEITHGLRTLDNNVLPGALQIFEEDNPACVAADMMLDKLYGGGQSPGIVAANITRFLDEWVAWAELNDQLVDDGNGGSIRRHVFNGVFDNESNLWDQLNVVGRMSRAQLIPLGRDYGVFLDQPDTFTQIFTMGNIADDSFNETWMMIDDRANQVEIQFADSTRFWKQDNPLVYMDPANQDAGVAIKNVRIDGKGITIPAQAWHLARFKERCNQFLLRTGSFKTDVDGIASRPGNVVLLQHDVPEWGWGGRTLPGSTASNVFVDRDDIPFVAGTAYSLIVLFPSIERYTGTIIAAAPVIDVTGANVGTQLSLSSFDNDRRITRAVVVTSAGVSFDCPISSTGAGLVVIQPVAGFVAAAGQTYTLHDTDVLETATVTGISALDGSLILGTPLTQPPCDYSTYFYGPVGSQKLVRIVNIRKASEFRAVVEWIDYDERVYTDATPILGSTSAQITSNPGVTSLKGSEVLSIVSGSYISTAALTWINGPDTVGVGIYAVFLHNVTNAPSGIPQMVARLTNQATSWSQQISPGTIVKYTVVGFDTNNRYAGFNSAPSVTITALGSVVAPPTGMALSSSAATAIIGPDGVVHPRIEVQWTAPVDILTNQIEMQIQLAPGGVATGPWLAAGLIDAALTLGYIPDVVAGQEYNVQIRSVRGGSGAYSVWELISDYTVSITLSQIAQTALAPGTLVGEAYAGGTADILPGSGVGTFAARIGNLTVSVSPANYPLAVATQGQLWWVYYIDPTFAGGAVTAIATQLQTDFLNKIGYFLIDSVVTPVYVASGGGTGGRYSPHIVSDTGTRGTQYSFAAYDGDVTTAAVVSGKFTTNGRGSSSGSDGQCTWSGFAPVSLTVASVLHVVAQAIAASGAIPYTLTTSLGDLLSDSFSIDQTDYTIAVAAGTELSTITVTATVLGTSDDNTDSVSPLTQTASLAISEIYIQ